MTPQSEQSNAFRVAFIGICQKCQLIDHFEFMNPYVREFPFFLFARQRFLRKHLKNFVKTLLLISV